MQECSPIPGKPTLNQFSKRKKNKDKSWKFERNRQYNSDPHLDDLDLDIVYYVLENRGALDHKTSKKITTRYSEAPLEFSQTSAVDPFLQI